MTTYTQKAVHGAGIIFLMSIIASLGSYLTIVVLARRLGPAEYGLFNAVFTFLLFFLFFRDLGLPQALTKYIAEFRLEGRYDQIKTAITSAFTFQLGTSLLLAIVFFFLAERLAQQYFHNDAAVLMLRLLIIYLFSSVFFGTFKDILLGFQNMTILAGSEVLKNWLVLGLAVLFLHYGYGAYAPLWAYTLTMIIVSLILLFFFLRVFPYFRYTIVDFTPISKNLLGFGFPVIFTAFGGKIIAYIDTLMLTYFRTLPEVGIYNAILPSSMIFSHFIAGAIATVVFPLSAELWYKNDRSRLQAGLALLYKYLFVLTIPPVFTVIIFSDLFVGWFFGAAYLTGTAALQILLVGMTFFTVASINHNVIAAIGKPKEVLKIILLAAAVNFILNLLFIPAQGIVGAAVATTVSYLITLLLSTRKLAGYLEMKFPLRLWLKISLVTVLFTAVVYGARWYFQSFAAIVPGLNLAIAAGIGLLLYIPLLFLFQLVDGPEIKRYWRLARK